MLKTQESRDKEQQTQEAQIKENLEKCLKKERQINELNLSVWTVFDVCRDQ